MIRLEIAPEPASFTENVRKPGENAMALLAGKQLPHARGGRPIELEKTVTRKGKKEKEVKSIADFPYWQNCLDELHEAYKGICAYYCFRVEKGSLPHVEHVVAKMRTDSELAYEWSNYRLACGQANTYKGESTDVLDPTEIEDGWFQIDLRTAEVHGDAAMPAEVKSMVTDTIERLRLDRAEALEVRKHALEHFRRGRVQLGFLELDHPFLAKELIRQGIRTSEELPSLPRYVLERVEPEL